MGTFSSTCGEKSCPGHLAVPPLPTTPLVSVLKYPLSVQCTPKFSMNHVSQVDWFVSLTVRSSPGGATNDERTPDSVSCQSVAVWSTWVPPGTYWENESGLFIRPLSYKGDEVGRATRYRWSPQMTAFTFLVQFRPRWEEKILQCLLWAVHQGEPFLCISLQYVKGGVILRPILVRKWRLTNEEGTSPAPTASSCWMSEWNKCSLTLGSGCEADGSMQEAFAHPHRGSCEGLQPCLSQCSGMWTLLLTFPSWGTLPSKSFLSVQLHLTLMSFSCRLASSHTIVL